MLGDLKEVGDDHREPDTAFQVESGQVHAVAVTGKDRFPATPNVPTAIESGAVADYDVTTWYGLFGPKGMPADVVAKLNGADDSQVMQQTKHKTRTMIDRYTRVQKITQHNAAKKLGL